MALSLSALHAAVNTFVHDTFAPPEGSPVIFRFDEFGTSLSDLDTSEEGKQPDPTMVVEVFSQLVNRVPLPADADTSVVMTDDGLDDFFELQFLNRAKPKLSGTKHDKAEQKATFEKLRARASHDWDDARLTSVRDGVTEFRRAQATPGNWLADSAWTRHRLEIKGTPEVGGPDEPLTLRLRLPADAVQKALRLPARSRAAARPRLASLRMTLSRVRPTLVGTEPTAAEVPSPLRLGRLRPSDLAATRVIVPTAEATQPRPAPFRLGPVLCDLSFRDRLVLTRLVQEASPTEPVSTDVITVEFDYCLVHIERPWWPDQLLRSTAWTISGVEPGSLTDGNRPGQVPLLPVAMLAIRNLSINADWSGDEMTAAASAAGVGPFSLDPGLSSSGSLTHAGIQTIGWLLEPLPALPPLTVAAVSDAHEADQPADAGDHKEQP